MAMEENKRISKCSGCKFPSTEHDFGKVGPYCEGPAKDESPMLQACASPVLKFLGRERRQCDSDVKLRPQPFVSVALPDENSGSQATLSLSDECRPRPSHEVNAGRMMKKFFCYNNVFKIFQFVRRIYENKALSGIYGSK